MFLNVIKISSLLKFQRKTKPIIKLFNWFIFHLLYNGFWMCPVNRLNVVIILELWATIKTNEVYKNKYN